MALFGGSRDISLIKNISKELINDIIQTEVAYYKFALEQTNVNVYGEAPGKNYYEPLKIACLINRTDQAWSSDQFGSDINQAINFRFLKKSLQDVNLFPEIGDLLLLEIGDLLWIDSVKGVFLILSVKEHSWLIVDNKSKTINIIIIYINNI